MSAKQSIDWVWIWGPKFYLDSEGGENPLLSPGSLSSHVGTCHRDTEPGQLVLLYRTKPKMDAAYLLRTLGPAMVNEHWRPRGGTRGNWTYMAEYEVLARIEPSVSIREMKACQDLENWGALRGRMQGTFFKIPPQESAALWALLEGRVPSLSGMMARTRRSSELPLESFIESAIVKQLKTVGKLLGRDLELWKSPDGVKGRQLPCREAGGRIDLLCEDHATGDLIVIELKVVRAGIATFGQICSYLGWIRKHLAEKRPVRGVVIADGRDAAFQSALNAGASVEFHELRPIAGKLGLIS